MSGTIILYAYLQVGNADIDPSFLACSNYWDRKIQDGKRIGIDLPDVVAQSVLLN